MRVLETGNKNIYLIVFSKEYRPLQFNDYRATKGMTRILDTTMHVYQLNQGVT